LHSQVFSAAYAAVNSIGSPSTWQSFFSAAYAAVNGTFSWVL